MTQLCVSSRRFALTIAADNATMGKAAAGEVGRILREYTANRGKRVVVVFAAAPSQDSFLAHLAQEPGIDWQNVVAFHLDEYLDLPKGHPNTFEVYLREHIFGPVGIPEQNLHLLKDVDGDAATVAREYGSALREQVRQAQSDGSVYLAFIGIGVNGHIAFNEPGTDLWTEQWVVPVAIDETSVQQQYDDYKEHPNPDARYATLADVPREALTLSCAGILAADTIFCMVPGAQKAKAAAALVNGPVTDATPASLLRLHQDVHLYLDRDSAAGQRCTPIAR